MCWGVKTYPVYSAIPTWRPAWNWIQSAPRAPACRVPWPAATGSRTRTSASRPAPAPSLPRTPVLQPIVSLSSQKSYSVSWESPTYTEGIHITKLLFVFLLLICLMSMHFPGGIMLFHASLQENPSCAHTQTNAHPSKRYLLMSSPWLLYWLLNLSELQLPQLQNEDKLMLTSLCYCEGPMSSCLYNAQDSVLNKFIWLCSPTLVLQVPRELGSSFSAVHILHLAQVLIFCSRWWMSEIQVVGGGVEAVPHGNGHHSHWKNRPRISWDVASSAFPSTASPGSSPGSFRAPRE